jgi:hypothetical protein
MHRDKIALFLSMEAVSVSIRVIRVRLQLRFSLAATFR